MTSTATVCIELLDDLLGARFLAMMADIESRTMLTWHRAGYATAQVIIASQSHQLNNILLKSKKIWILLSDEPVHEDDPKILTLSPDCTPSDLVAALDTACLKLLKANASNGLRSMVTAPAKPAVLREPGDLYRVSRWVKMKPEFSDLRFSRALVALTRDSVSWKGLTALGLSDIDARSFLRELADAKVLIISRERDVTPATPIPVPPSQHMVALRTPPSAPSSSPAPASDEKNASANRGTPRSTMTNTGSALAPRPLPAMTTAAKPAMTQPVLRTAR